MWRAIKQFLKRAIKATCRRFGWAMPGPLRNELLRFYRYRRGPQPQSSSALQPEPYSSLPYWERREKPGGAKGRVRVGFVGAGAYAQHHLKVLNGLEQVTIGAILTIGGPRVHEAAARYSIQKTFTDIDEFLAQTDIDCFVVVVPMQHMFAVARQCLSTGRPVLMEKPAGVSPAETAELEQQARRNNTFGMVCMNRRFYSVLEHGLARLADCGPLRGAMLEVPHSITADRQSQRLSEWDYDHFLVRNSIHGIDLLRYILGDPVRVHSLAWPNQEFKNAAASFASLLEYERGVVASITDLWDTPQVWRLKVVAESGWVEFEPLERGWFVTHNGQKTSLKIDPIDAEFRMGVYAQDLRFVEAVRQGQKPGRPACLLPDAHLTMVLIDRILDNRLGRPKPDLCERSA